MNLDLVWVFIIYQGRLKMPRGKTVFIVEGELEKKFLSRQCNDKLVIRKIQSNGNKVSVDCIAKMVKSILRLIRNPGDIFVVIDREGRDETSEELEQLIHGKILAAVPGIVLSVHVADRMIENWILADGKALSSENLEIEGVLSGFEGCGGKARIKAAFKKNNSSYSETVDGVRLLERCIPAVIAQNSASFSRFYQELLQKVGFCGWVTKTN